MKRITLLLCILFIITTVLQAQNGGKSIKFLGEIFNVDSADVLLIPVEKEENASIGKSLMPGYYHNLIVFDYVNNRQKKMFEKDTYIRTFRNNYFYYGRYNNSEDEKPKNITSKYLFLFVNNVDYDGNGKIETTDPSILYVCDLKGNNLKPLTPKNENAMNFELFEKQGFILVRMQKDYTGNKEFNYKDKDFYYLKIDLNTLKITAKIQL